MKYILIILGTAILTFTIVTYVFFNKNALINIDEIEFSTIDREFTFTCIPSKGRDYAMMNRAFEEYKLKNSGANGLEIYRITAKNYFKISSWCLYKTAPEWNHDYLSVWKR